MRNKRNKTWMAACTLVVIVAFGSACTTTQTHQITQESFRSLQKDTNPKPTHVIKTTGTKLWIKSDFREHLGIVQKTYGNLKIDPKFSMTDTEIRIPVKNTGEGVDQYQSFKIPLDEISAYYITEKSLTGSASFGILAGVLAGGMILMIVALAIGGGPVGDWD